MTLERTMIALAWAVALSVLGAGRPALPYWDGGGNGEHAAWFNSLKQPGTAISCCGTGDAFRVASYKVDGDHYAARLTDGRTIPIPNERMLREANPIGEAIVFIDGSGKVLCFVKAPEI